MTLGKYLYCVIRCPEERTFEGVPAVGGCEAPVQAIPYDGLAAVVSDSVAQEYAFTRANLLAHERVQERVMQECTLLPVRFGTVTRNSASAIADIQKLLEKRSQEFDGLLAEMEGKVELGLKALWRDEKAIFQEIVAENPAIQRLRDSLRRQPPAVVRQEGIRLGEMVKEALEQKKRREVAALLAPLRHIAARLHENDVIVDRMIVNAAFLVGRGREEELDEAVNRLSGELGQRVVFRYTGPNPPWNFVDIVVNWEEL